MTQNNYNNQITNVTPRKRKLNRKIDHTSATDEPRINSNNNKNSDVEQQLEDPFDSQPVSSQQSQPTSFTITKKGLLYQFSTPANYISSPNKPYIQMNDREKLNKYFDICLKSDKSFSCSEATKQQFISLQESSRKNSSFVTREEEYNWLKLVFDLEHENFIDDLITRSKNFTSNQFVQFMKFTLIDFYANCERPVPVPLNNERSIYVETFIPILKYFANFTKSLGFTWCEKQLPANSVWYMLSDYSKSGVNKKFVDGIGVTVTDNTSSLIIESSGYQETEDVEHMLGDTLKNLKNASDCLKHLISEFKLSSYDTFKKVKVFSIHIIQTSMTLVQYGVSSPEKWQAVECRSATVPLSWNNRQNFVKVFELLAFLLDELKEQKEVFDMLKKERVGLVPVPSGRSVDDILVH